MTTSVIMPQLGESVIEGTVSRWLKAEGDTVIAYEPLLEVSTDKVDTEIPAPASGILLQILVAEGQTVERGTPLALIGERERVSTGNLSVEDLSVGDVSGQDASPAPVMQSTAIPSPAADHAPPITPVVARMVAEHGLNLGALAGSGRGGRVTKKDVEAFLETRGNDSSQSPITANDDLPPWERPGSGDLFKPTVDYGDVAAVHVPVETAGQIGASPVVSLQKAPPASNGSPSIVPARLHPVEAIPATAEGDLIAHTPMRRAIADHMVNSKHTSPHVTTVFEIDCGAIIAHRKANQELYARQGVNLTLTAYFAAAVVTGLRAVPLLNARWTDAGIYTLRAVNLGIAVAIESGLIVPVIHHAGDLNLIGMARAINDLAARARARTLKPDEVSGGTFTISNHGVSGSLFATPIINQPQAGILGVGVIEKRVRVMTDVNGSDMIAIRPMCYLSLTFDHRIADGATADGFLSGVKRTIEAGNF